jgi:hypothetical protein
MTYERGFSDGERQAFTDRRSKSRDGEHSILSAGFSTALAEYWRGFRDGYFPRGAW